ncbi:putative universal stress protein [Rubripirellula tenax]|uniref:Putative universal stress protein n=1 Tax=Rubripirellula tenax TaxID=2528015 RepID=A0A5C6ER99_9BACT|nr:universal stress protein [Rubripirellula tenax]TWU50577.1 putative universal stress protein [Rubripirellula tenax]
MKILLPTDGSQPASDAVDLVKTLAQNRDIDVVVLTVSYDPAHYSMQPWVTEWTEQENLRTKAILEAAETSLKDVCKSVTLVHGSGATVPCILDKAMSLKPDLIVLGAKGHSAVRRVLLGSVSDSIATSATCSVVVVRSKPESGSGIQRIVLGFDQSIASREAVAELTQWNLPRDRQIDVISVVPQPYDYADEGYIGVPITVDPKQVDRLDEAAERMASQIAEHFPHTNAKTPVAAHVGEAIVQAAEDDDAGLIVVGDTGHSLLGQLMLGSTSKYVLRHAPCSVWISRHHWTSDVEAEEVSDAVAAS